MRKLIALLLLCGAAWWAWTNHPDWFKPGTPREGNGTRGVQRMTGGAKEAEQIK